MISFCGVYFHNFTLCHFYARTCYIIYWYVLYNFWKYLFVKIAARVLGAHHIATSLEHLGTVPSVQAWTTSALCQVFKWRHYLSWAQDTCEFFWQIGISKIWITIDNNGTSVYE